MLVNMDVDNILYNTINSVKLCMDHMSSIFNRLTMEWYIEKYSC